MYSAPPLKIEYAHLADVLGGDPGQLRVAHRERQREPSVGAPLRAGPEVDEVLPVERGVEERRRHSRAREGGVRLLLGVEVRHLEPLLERRHPVVVERDEVARVLERRPDHVLDARRFRRGGLVLGLFDLLLRREVLPEVRHAERAVRARERTLEAALVVEVGLDDLGTGGGERLGRFLARVSRHRADGESAVRVGQDRAGEPSALCAGGADDRDHLCVAHISSSLGQGRDTTSAAIRSGPGRNASSSGGLYGIGEFGVVMRQASSRSPRPCSVTSASTSPAQPPVSGPSSTTAMRFVFCTERQDRLDVERPERSQVDHLGRDALLGEQVRGGQAVVDALHRADERDVVAFANDRGLPERQRLAAACRPGHRVQALVLEEDHRVVVADRGLQQPLRVGGRRRGDDLQPGDAGQPRDRHLRVDRPEPAAAADDRPDHERDALPLPGQEPVLRRLVDQAVHRQGEEVAEHDLQHGALPRDRRAERRARHRQLGDRRVEDALRPVLLVEPGRGREHASGDGDVLAEEDDTVVAGELLVERVANRVSELELHGCLRHAVTSATGRSSRVLSVCRNRAASAP